MNKNRRGGNGLSEALSGAFKNAGKSLPASKKKKVTSNKAKKKKARFSQSKTLKKNQQRVQAGRPKKKASKANAKSSGGISAVHQLQVLEKVAEAKSSNHSNSKAIENDSASRTDTGNQRQGSLELLTQPENVSVGQFFKTKSDHQTAPHLNHMPSLWSKTAEEERLVNPRVLRVGLDMGTSATKVVVADVTRGDTAWAIPFIEAGSNPYLLPTAIKWVDGKPSIDCQSNTQKPFKWRLINDELNRQMLIDASAYLALVLRHIVAWVHENHGDYYSGKSIFWELRVGLPAESSENVELCSRYLALQAVAVKIASVSGEIQKQQVEKEVDEMVLQLFKGEQVRTDASFEESGFVLSTNPTPEVAANIEGFFRSRKWNTAKPYGLLLDVGASTLDCAFCSFQDQKGDAELHEFARGVESLGVFRLHDSRTEWIIDQLESKQGFDKELYETLLDQLTSVEFDQPIPTRIDDYLENVKFNNPPIDRDFKSQLAATVGRDNLIKGANEFFLGHIPKDTVIPVYISGGGVRHEIYQSYLQRVSDNANTGWSLEIEPLSIPNFVHAPLIEKDQRDRLTVAYGLCADENWAIKHPDEIEKYQKEEN